MTPPDPPYDLPRLQAMAASLRELLAGAGEQRELTEVADSFQRIMQDFETEHGKLDAEVAAKLAEARAKVDQAQATMREVEAKLKQAQAPAPLDEPDWSLGPRLRDELLASRAAAPPPIELGESLAPWALAPDPLPDAPPPTPAPAITPITPPMDSAHSMASWLFDSPPIQADLADPPPLSAAGHSSMVSWFSSSAPPAPPAANQDKFKEEMKQWLTKPRGER